MLAILHGALGDLVVTLPLLELLARDEPLEVWGPAAERTALLGPPRGPAAVARGFPPDALPLWGDDFAARSGRRCPPPAGSGRAPAVDGGGPPSAWIAARLEALADRLRAGVVAVSGPGPLARNVTALGGVVIPPPARAGEPGPALHATEALLAAYGGGDVDPRPRLRRRPGDAARAASLAGAERFVVVHPGSGGVAKQWPAAAFAEAVEGLDLPVVVVTGPAEAERGLADLALLTRGRAHLVAPPLDDLCALLASAAAVLGNDAGPSHLAAALDAPLVAVFTGPSAGPDGPLRWAPRGRAPVRVLQDPRPAAAGEALRALL